MVKKNTKIKVADNHSIYAGRIGYFQYEGQGNISGFWVLSSKPLKNREVGKTFSVEKEYCILT